MCFFVQSFLFLFLLCHRIVYPNQAKSGLGNTPFSLISNSYTSFLFPIMHFISSACQIVHYMRWCMLSMDPYTPAVSSLRLHSIDVFFFFFFFLFSLLFYALFHVPCEVKRLMAWWSLLFMDWFLAYKRGGDSIYRV